MITLVDGFIICSCIFFGFFLIGSGKPMLGCLVLAVAIVIYIKLNRERE